MSNIIRRLKDRCSPKSKKSTDETPQVFESHAQFARSQSALPLHTTVVPATGVDSPHDEILPDLQQGPLPCGAAAPDLPVANRPQEAVSGDAKHTRDLWEEAFTKLDEDKKSLLAKIAKPQGSTVVEQVAEQTKKSYIEREEKGWKIARGKGKPDIKLRAAFKETLFDVLKVKQLLSAGIAFDPTGHASAAWTIVSLGLQMTKNDADIRKNVFETCDRLAETLYLLAAVDASFRDKSLPSTKHLEDTIIVVYVAILELSAEIVRENCQNTSQRILSSFTTLAEQPLHDFTETLQAKKQILREWTDIVEHQYRTQEKEELDHKVSSALSEIEKLAQQVMIATSELLTAEEHMILEWLSRYPFSDSHVAAASSREPGTGAWILSLPEYEKWKRSESSLLWLYGNC